MVSINNAFRKKIIEDMFSKLKDSPATATLSLQIYNKDVNINKDTKLTELDSPVETFDITPSDIDLARQVTADWDLTIAGLKYKTISTVPDDENYWNVLIAEVALTGTDGYNIVALVYTEHSTEITIPILIEKYAKTKTLTEETITIVVKF